MDGLEYREIHYPYVNGYFALDNQNRPRFVIPFPDGIILFPCDSNFTTPSSWNWYCLNLDQWLAGLKLLYTSNGKLRLAAVDPQANQLYHLECSNSCSQGGNWSKVKAADDILLEPLYAFRLARRTGRGWSITRDTDEIYSTMPGAIPIQLHPQTGRATR
jgi:hypothetical protein